MPVQYTECPIKSMLSIQSLFTFFRRTFSHDFQFSGEAHDFTEAVCIIGGRVGITADKNIYVLSAGQMVVHAPNEFHSIWPDNEEAEAIIFSFRSGAFPALDKNVFTLTNEQIAEICNLYQRAKEVFTLADIHVTGVREHKEAEAAVIIKQLEILLLNILATDHPATPRYSSQSAASYVRIVNAMEESLGGPLNIELLAAKCNLSVSAIEKTVHRYMGCGAIAYFNNLRMQRAAAMLNAGKSVKEVAFALGFSCQNYFSSAFKKWAKQSPSAFKK